MSAGKKTGKGSAGTQRSHMLRAKLLESISESMVQGSIETLSGLAIGGNLTAIKLLLEYAAGRPAQAREIAVPEREPQGLNLEELQTVLLEALSPHPQAKVDLAASLDSMARAQAARPALEDS